MWASSWLTRWPRNPTAHPRPPPPSHNLSGVEDRTVRNLIGQALRPKNQEFLKELFKFLRFGKVTKAVLFFPLLIIQQMAPVKKDQIN